jgi:hypothetical protein
VEHSSIVIKFVHRGKEIIYDAISYTKKWDAHMLAISLSILFDQVEVLYYTKETDEKSSLRTVYKRGMVTQSSNYTLYGRMVVANKHERGK